MDVGDEEWRGVLPDLRWVSELGGSEATVGVARLACPLDPEGTGAEEVWRQLVGAKSRLLRWSASKSDLLKVMV